MLSKKQHIHLLLAVFLVLRVAVVTSDVVSELLFEFNRNLNSEKRGT